MHPSCIANTQYSGRSRHGIARFVECATVSDFCSDFTLFLPVLCVRVVSVLEATMDVEAHYGVELKEEWDLEELVERAVAEGGLRIFGACLTRGV